VSRLFGVGVLLTLLLAVAFGCSGSSGEVSRIGAEINAFEIASGDHRTGYPLLASAGMRSTATVRYTYWMGYSVKNPKGEWYDAPAIPVELTPGQDSGARGFTTKPLSIPGLHTARTAIWTDDPADKDAGAALLDKSETTFRVYQEREDFDSLDPDRWKKDENKLGRGQFQSDNADTKDGNLRLKIPKKDFDGAQISSEKKYGYGSYTARIKVPDAPTSITGFFLYEPPDFQSEVDIEIHNDPKGKILFTTYADGEQTHTRTMDLPFDPTKKFHDYGFEYRKDEIIFHVDDRPMTTFEEGIPDRPMNLYVNTWYPQWLAGKETSQDRSVLVDSIEN
jgi:hypothetical protein